MQWIQWLKKHKRSIYTDKRGSRILEEKKQLAEYTEYDFNNL